jgi:menaquinone-dependent protoporphyrinogen oxidase
MKPFLVLYATRDGHTKRIAEHVANALRARGFSTDLVDAARLRSELPLRNYCGAVLAASVHRHKHEPEMTRFVRRHVNELERIPSGFLSVSLSEAGAEDPEAPAERRAQSAKDAQGMVDAFLVDTGWHPCRTQAVAGAPVYSKYNFVVRYMMRRIARQAGGNTDTSKDYVYTGWKRLDEFVDELTSSVMSEPSSGR